MRNIAKKASVTTGALSARFSNKNALFSAIVNPIAKSFMHINSVGNEYSKEKIKKNDLEDIWCETNDTASKLLELIYSNREIFFLLINCSTGSDYENFMDRIVEYEERETTLYLQQLKNNNYPCLDLSEQEIHMLISTHVYALFEIVRHDIPKEEAIKQVNNINDFFACGWSKIFGSIYIFLFNLAFFVLADILSAIGKYLFWQYKNWDKCMFDILLC